MKPMPVMRWAIAILALVSWGASAAELDLGDPLPMQKAKLQNVDGRKLTLAEMQGKRGTLVIFACNHCPFVQAWQARIAAIGNESRSNQVGVVLINSNDPAAYPTDDLKHMQEQAKKAGFQFPYVVDETSDVARAFGAKRTPEVFLFDAKAKLVYHGAIDDNAYHPDQVKHPYLREAIDALLAGEEIPRQTTRSVGCSIKFRPEKKSAGG